LHKAEKESKIQTVVLKFFKEVLFEGKARSDVNRSVILEKKL
jgi:hypothetical protein